jgi:hypothetical protein
MDAATHKAAAETIIALFDSMLAGNPRLFDDQIVAAAMLAVAHAQLAALTI